VWLGIILVVLLPIFTLAEGWGADWKEFYDSDIGKYFYDAENMDRPTGDIVMVYVKSVLTERGIWGWVQRLGNDFNDLSYTINLSELNCADRRWRWLVMDFYSKEDKILKSITADTLSGWDLSGPESLMEPLFEAVCQ
jgi:hypothetical protein